jgi:serine/threonine-protein kinase
MGEPELAPISTERIGRYEIVMQIAKGGMATVYLARAEGLGGFDRYVAVKLTADSLRNDPEFSAHLIEEAKLVAHLRHLNVVPVLDVGECDRGVFLVMEYIPGDSLAGLVRRAREAGTPLPPRVGLRVLVDTLAGLHAAHEHADEEGHPLHLVHRDFSPQNILVGTDGIARLTDFGIAKAASRASNTVQGHIKGKISYVAPEQAKGGEIDRRCDLWAAGVIAWELLAGKKLHGTNMKALLEIATTEPAHVRTAAPDVPEALDAVIAAVLKIDRDARTPTAAVLARELAAAAKAANLLAETDEVAEHVARLTGPTLAERKERIAAARRQRMGSSPEISVSGPSSTGAMRRVLPSLPEIPIQTISGGVVVLPDADYGSQPTVVPPPSANAHVEIVMPPPIDGATPPSTEQAAPAGLFADKRTRLAVYGGAALLSVGVLAVTLALALGGRKTDDATLASASASAAQGGASAIAAPTTTTPSAPVDQGVWPATLDVAADAPIASLKIGARTAELSSPTPKVTLELEPEESGDVTVVATSADGRSASGTAKGGAVEISFANAPPATRPAVAPAPAPAPAPRAPAPKPPPRRR